MHIVAACCLHLHLHLQCTLHTPSTRLPHTKALPQSPLSHSLISHSSLRGARRAVGSPVWHVTAQLLRQPQRPRARLAGSSEVARRRLPCGLAHLPQTALRATSERLRRSPLEQTRACLPTPLCTQANAHAHARPHFQHAAPTAAYLPAGKATGTEGYGKGNSNRRPSADTATNSRAAESCSQARPSR